MTSLKTYFLIKKIELSGNITTFLLKIISDKEFKKYNKLDVRNIDQINNLSDYEDVINNRHHEFIKLVFMFI